MKKFVLAIAALTAMTVSASAADLAVKAPPPAAPAPVYNWTGFYIFGGAGGGIWAADQSVAVTGTGVPLTVDHRTLVGAGQDQILWAPETRFGS